LRLGAGAGAPRSPVVPHFQARRTVPPNIALVGCGAIARTFYLPALAKHRGEFGHLWLVDPNDRAVATASATVAGRQARQLTDVDDEIHLVIIATPNQLHCPLAHEALSRDAHVLIEKPFVIWPEEGRSLVEAAAAKSRVIAINQTRRFFSVTRDLRRRISEGAFGPLKSIVHREGTKLTWPFESGAAFAQGAQRTGVIMDFGVHVIDFYHYLLKPRWTLVSAIHDGFQGPEGLAEIELQADDAPVSIRLSRYHAQENAARLVFDRADIAFNVYDPNTYTIRPKSGSPVRVVGGADPEENSHADLLLLNFLAASQGREPVVCDAASSLPVIDILDEAYRFARHYSATLGAV
jgi:predicted dehydrogenase